MEQVPGTDLTAFAFTLVPKFEPEYLHDNIRSSVARGLPTVDLCHAHGEKLSIVGGGPSLADTYKDLTGYVAAINGSLGWLLDHGVVPQMCGVCDPSDHMAGIVRADPRVSYFLASIVHPSVYDKLLNAGCTVYRWNISSIPGGEELLKEIEPTHFTVGGGSTMGLRWIPLGYSMGFREFHCHGMDSSFRMDPERGKASHAYPDHQDEKTDWLLFDGYQTRVNFIGQVADFLGWMERLSLDDVEPVRIEVYGDGLLQSKFREWRANNPFAHTGKGKPIAVTDGFAWPGEPNLGILQDVRFMDRFLAHVKRFRTVIQAGGNVGVYPAHLAQRFSHVHSFEPDPANYACLAQNLELNGGNVKAYMAALGEENGTCGLAAFTPGNNGAIRVSGEGNTPVRTIDGLGVQDCDLIWLDIEGYELNALKGAEKTIAACRPAVIIEENNLPELHGIAPGAARAWLEARGYQRRVRYGNDILFVPGDRP